MSGRNYEASERDNGQGFIIPIIFPTCNFTTLEMI